MGLKDNGEFAEMDKHLKRLIKLQDEAYAKLSPEQYEHVKTYHLDAHEMIRGMKKGDFNGIQDLLNKFLYQL